MGDRANLVVETRPGQRVLFYTHHGGEYVPYRLQKGLRQRKRWDDPPYLARILFDALVGERHGTTIGYGIDVDFGDNNRDVLVVRCERQVVEVHAFDREKWSVKNWHEPLIAWHFGAFCAIRGICWERVRPSTDRVPIGEFGPDWKKLCRSNEA